jgi:Xaa-Pro aminopeptidase
LRDARRVGTDGLTPMFAGLISELVTKADLADAGPVMASARRTKTPDEITCLDVASAIAEAALSAMEDALAPARHLRRTDSEPGRADAAVGKRLLRDGLERSGQVPAPGI